MDFSIVTQWIPFSLEWSALLLIAAIFGFDTMRNGASRAVAASLAFPVTYGLFLFIQSAIIIGPLVNPLPDSMLSVFIAALYAISYVLVYRITEYYDRSIGLVSGILAGISTTALFAVFWISFEPLHTLWQFSAPMEAILGETYRFWWLLVALSLLAFMRR